MRAISCATFGCHHQNRTGTLSSAPSSSGSAPLICARAAVHAIAVEQLGARRCRQPADRLSAD